MRVLIVLLIILLAGCRDFGAEKAWTFTMKNSSAKTVWYYLSFKLPDTSLALQRPQRVVQIKPGMEIPEDNNRRWEDVIDTIPAKKLAIYIIDEDTLNTYSWNTIRDNYKVSKRFELSANDLIQSNWVVNYQ